MDNKLFYFTAHFRDGMMFNTLNEKLDYFNLENGEKKHNSQFK